MENFNLDHGKVAMESSVEILILNTWLPILNFYIYNIYFFLKRVLQQLDTGGSRPGSGAKRAPPIRQDSGSRRSSTPGTPTRQVTLQAVKRKENKCVANIIVQQNYFPIVREWYSSKWRIFGVCGLVTKVPCYWIAELNKWNVSVNCNAERGI